MVGHLKGISQRDSHPRVWMTLGRGMLEKFNRITWRSGWTPRLEKFLEKSWWAFSSLNRTWRRGTIGSEEDDDPKRKGFRVGVDLCLGVIHSLSEREREKTDHTIIREYKEGNEKVHMHEICMSMWHAKRNCIIGSTQSKPNSTQFSINKHTSKCMKYCENAKAMQCMIIYH